APGLSFLSSPRLLGTKDPHHDETTKNNTMYKRVMVASPVLRRRLKTVADEIARRGGAVGPVVAATRCSNNSALEDPLGKIDGGDGDTPVTTGKGDGGIINA